MWREKPGGGAAPHRRRARLSEYRFSPARIGPTPEVMGLRVNRTEDVGFIDARIGVFWSIIGHRDLGECCGLQHCGRVRHVAKTQLSTI